MADKQKFSSEVIDLPSEGKLYPDNHPLKDGKIEIKYMTAREEDILTSANLIKKGVVIEKLLDENKFEIKLPISKTKITFKILTGLEEKKINEELKASKKVGSQVSPELTTRLRHTITSVDGDNSIKTINNFVIDMLARDSLFLRQEIAKVAPDIIMEQEVEIGGETVEVNIPMTVGFFWPNT